MNLKVFFGLLLIIGKVVVSEINVTQINGSDLYVYHDGLYFGMFMVTPKGVVAIDAPPSVATTGVTITDIIRRYTNKPIKWVIYSHHHIDHIGGASEFPSDATYICHKDASEYILTDTNHIVPSCNRIINSNHYNLNIDNNHKIELDYHGEIHSNGNLYIYVPFQKLLMLIDFVFPKWGPYYNLGMQSSIHKYYQAFDNVLDYDFNYYIGGHVDTIGTRNDVIVAKEFIDDLIDSINEGIENIDYSDIVTDNGGYNGVNTFTIYRAYIDAVVEYCVNKMINDLAWDERLHDATAFMDSHCFLVMEYVNIDY